MKTVTVQIGNSDDKLTQERWAKFNGFVNYAIARRAHKIHFSGHSNSVAPWQNSAWVFEIEKERADMLLHDLATLCEMFSQDSIAWTEGETQFIKENKSSDFKQFVRGSGGELLDATPLVDNGG